MQKFLLIDIGAGTMDILCFDRTSDLHYKAISRSPVITLANKIDRIPGNLFINGSEMGGGRLSKILKKRACEATVVMTQSAATTIHHDLNKVLSLGIHVVADEQAEQYLYHNEYTTVTSGDLDVIQLEKIIKGLGVSFEFDAVGVCAQDHGIPPRNMSHLDHRHKIFKTALDIPSERHLMMQGAFQRHADNSVSKTVNLPRESTPEDVGRVYWRAWKLGLKGITVYRYGSRSSQVLEPGAGERGYHYDHAAGCDPEECRV